MSSHPSRDDLILLALAEIKGEVKALADKAAATSAKVVALDQRTQRLIVLWNRAQGMVLLTKWLAGIVTSAAGLVFWLKEHIRP